MYASWITMSDIIARSNCVLKEDSFLPFYARFNRVIVLFIYKHV